MERHEPPPDIVVRRLPLYARSLHYLLEEGVSCVSSQELGDRINITAAQIRKDLSYFGEFGKQGIGYDVAQLMAHIEHILGLVHEWPLVLVGIGRLGEAIARNEEFGREGIRIAALFDSDPKKIGGEVAGIPVRDVADLEEFVREKGIKLAILAVPPAHAQGVADQLIAAGVRAILSYAPVVLHTPDDIWVRYIDPLAVLHSMTYYLAREEAAAHQA